MAGSQILFTYDSGTDASLERPGVRKVIITWISDSASGAVTGTTDLKIVGEISKIVTLPGSPAPSNNYTVTLTDSDGVNLLTNCDKTMAGNQSSTVAVETYAMVLSHAGTPIAVGLRPCVCSPITIAVSSAGDSKQGSIEITYAVLK